MQMKTGIALAALIAAGMIAYLALVILPPPEVFPAASPEETPALWATPAPQAREPLDGERITIGIGFAYIPDGIISEETESYLSEGILIGNPVKARYYHGNYGENREFIRVVQEVLLPEEAYVDEAQSFGSFGRRFKWPPGFPLGFPTEMTGTDTLSIEVFRNGFPPGVSTAERLMFNVFAFGNVYYITYKDERVVMSTSLGNFLVGEAQSGLFWFLFQQLGSDRALIINAESYEEWWGAKEREEWVVSLTPPPATATPEIPPTMFPLPPGTTTPPQGMPPVRPGMPTPPIGHP